MPDDRQPRAEVRELHGRTFRHAHGCSGPAANRGAISYDAIMFDPATAPRATTQAVLGLTGVKLANLHGGGKPQAPTLA